VTNGIDALKRSNHFIVELTDTLPVNHRIPSVEFVISKLNRANMAAGTTMQLGQSQRLNLEDAGNPPHRLKIAYLAILEQTRS
jgi:hypothetical protein